MAKRITAAGELEQRRMVGQILSNMAFNLSQHLGIHESLRTSLRDYCRQWDAIKFAKPAKRTRDKKARRK